MFVQTGAADRIHCAGRSVTRCEKPRNIGYGASAWRNPKAKSPRICVAGSVGRFNRRCSYFSFWSANVRPVVGVCRSPLLANDDDVARGYRARSWIPAEYSAHAAPKSLSAMLHLRVCRATLTRATLTRDKVGACDFIVARCEFDAACDKQTWLPAIRMTLRQSRSVRL